MRPLGRGKRAGAGGQVGRGNAVGVDPHKHTLTASVIDERGGELGTRSFRVSGVGHRDMEAWAVSFGAVVRWGVEGAGGLGRHTAMYLVGRGHDVRDVCPTRTAERARRRRQGKTDALDSVRIARETQADPDIAVAFKRAGPEAALDANAEVMGLWHGARRSILKSRQHLLNESEALLVALPLGLRETLPDTKDVRTRLNALARRDRTQAWDPSTALRLRLLEDHAAAIGALDAKDKEATNELGKLIERDPRSAGCAGWPRSQWPSCWWRRAIPAASRARAASPGSTGRRRCRPHPGKGTAARCAIVSTAVGTAG